MVLSREQAAEALRAIEETGDRSRELRSYSRRAPHLILWGAIWAAGYALSDFFPQWAWTIWAIAIPAGLVAGAVIDRRARSAARWRYAAVALAIAAFCFATFSIMAPVGGRQVAAFIPLVVATGYVLVGIWTGSRLIVSGIAVAALTLGGYFLLPAHFLLWMAIVGGGALVSAGVWLGRA